MNKKKSVEEMLDQAADEYMYQIAIERQNDKADIPLSEVVEEEDLRGLDLNRIDIELDEE